MSSRRPTPRPAGRGVETLNALADVASSLPIK
jgi:hypothetical protein